MQLISTILPLLLASTLSLALPVTKTKRSATTAKAKTAKHVEADDDDAEMSELTDAPETASEYTENADEY